MAHMVSVRRARKKHQCTGGYCRTIQPGELYLRHTATPNDPDTGSEHWRTSAECADCAERYGRPVDRATP